ncbi:hypothetical protein WJX84_007625 [Apatococcus fuscideae]|uniref:Uncharacterized protein n=1 Tax=Apatococcus fuscideae TaxID=2026836 RepID=A0AAW1SV72_9CHLO
MGNCFLASLVLFSFLDPLLSAPAPAPAAPRPATSSQQSSPPRAPAPTVAPAPPTTFLGTRPPVFLLPGSGASTLDSTWTNSTLKAACSPTAATSTIWLQDINTLTGDPTCIQAALLLTFNSTTSLPY